MFTREMLQGRFWQVPGHRKPDCGGHHPLFPGHIRTRDAGHGHWRRVGHIPLGVLCVRYAGRLPDNLLRVVSLVGHSMPIFWLGIVGLLVFYAQLGWVGGPGRLDIAYRYSVPDVTHLGFGRCLAGNWDAFANAVSHIVLPASLLGLVALGYITRMTRSFLLAQMRQDYTLVLRLKGLSESAILWRHALHGTQARYSPSLR